MRNSTITTHSNNTCDTTYNFTCEHSCNSSQGANAGEGINENNNTEKS